ncbi:MAG: cytochrome ubiquinol oxidase subunit I [Balneolaceae bacterium]
MDVEILSRIQFAFTISFHYIFPPLSIGLGLMMVLFEGNYLRTKEKKYELLARFWTKIFAVTFGLGVATGIVMEFEFGTNWATYSRYVGDIFGSALAAEGLFAFALESGFLGLLLFGWNKTTPIVHFIGTLGVWLGSMFSAVWIVVANSWQQTPAGFQIVGEGNRARAEIVDFWAMVFNPSSIDRILHVWNGAFLAGAFFVLSVSAWYIIKNKHLEMSKTAFKTALVLATICSLAQLVSGHSSAEVVAENQPAKLAAMEGHFDSGEPADLYLFGWVDKEAQKTYGLGIPGGTSFLLYQDFNAPVTSLNDIEPENRPTTINAIFQFYHIMIAIGMALIGLTLLSCFYWFKGNIFEKKWLMWLFVPSVLLPQIANQAGWFTAELGRQPWVVYDLLRISDALSNTVKANQVLFSIIMFALVYALLFFLFIYLLNKKIQHGPEELSPEDDMYYDKLTGA